MKEKQKKQYSYYDAVLIAKLFAISKICSKNTSTGIKDQLLGTIWIKNQEALKEKNKSKMSDRHP